MEREEAWMRVALRLRLRIRGLGPGVRAALGRCTHRNWLHTSFSAKGGVRREAHAASAESDTRRLAAAMRVSLSTP